MNLRLIRHATLWMSYAGQQLLIDPMFADPGANPPINNSTNDRRNPLVPLSVPVEELIQPDGVLVTHLHKDHWDAMASSKLASDIPLFCQPGDASSLRAEGFQHVQPVSDSIEWRNLSLSRTSGRHGTGLTGKLMGTVSGFVLQAAGEPTAYIAGDTIWCKEVREALDRYEPAYTIVNAGAAQFKTGGPITMDVDDVIKLCRYAPRTTLIAVHMEAINHCLLTREELKRRLAEEGLEGRVIVPEDGDSVDM